MDTIRRRPTQSRFVQNAPQNVRGNMAARRLQLFAQREWANELSSFSIEISGVKVEVSWGQDSDSPCIKVFLHIVQ